MSATAISSKEFFEEYIAAMSGLPKTEALLDKYVSDPPLREHILQFETAFPNYQVVIEDLVAEGDLVALRGKFHGTHNGEFAGIPPTGKEITAEIAGFYRIEDQKVSKFWLIADTTKLLNELRG
jgi:predicted ester cyclase